MQQILHLTPGVDDMGGFAGVISRPVRVGAVAVSALAITAFTGALASAGAATAAPAAGQGFVALAGSVSPTTDIITAG